MERMKRFAVAASVVVALGVVVPSVLASPAVDSAAIHTRLWNDDPTSTIVTTNTYARNTGTGAESGVVQINETNHTHGWNRHYWRFSDDGGSSDAVFQNGDAFKVSADITLTGDLDQEAGLNLPAWWTGNCDGTFMVRTSGNTSDEISVWGGRLPFFNFSSTFGVVYTKGNTIHEEVSYIPPPVGGGPRGWIKYDLSYLGNDYSSGWLGFDQGNPAEDPPHGQWGLLTPLTIGGYTINKAGAAGTGTADTLFANVHYSAVPEPASLALLALASLALGRKR